MAYINVKNFRLGLDRTGEQINGEPGSLWEGINVHINRKGEIERRKKFVSKYSLPTGTFGLHITGDTMYVFGSGTDPGVPSGVTYQRLQHPDGTTAMSDVIFTENFDGEPYVIAEFADGDIYHFHGGVIVEDWHAGIVRDDMTNNDGIAAHLAALIDGVDSYSATSSGAVVTVTGPDDVVFTWVLTTANGGATDDQALAANTTQAASAGTPQITDFTVSGTFEAGDKFNIALTKASKTWNFGHVGKPTARGRTALTFKSKIYSTAGSLVQFSGVGDATVWDSDNPDTPGANFINAASYDEGSKTLYGLGVFLGNLAFFARNVVQTWSVDTDEDNNVFLETVKRTGTRSPRSIQAIGNRDLFYLHDSGSRSLRARDSSNSASVDDVGTAIDTLMQEYMATLTSAQIEGAVSVLEPFTDRYLLALGGRIFAFSIFPTKKISAWTYYDTTDDIGADIAAITRNDERIYARAGDIIYEYGGPDGDTYPDADEIEATVFLPYLDADTPGTVKNFEGVDVACTGTWRLQMAVNPADNTHLVDCGYATENSFAKGRIPFNHSTTHVAPKLTCSDAGAAKVMSLLVHYEDPNEAG